MSNSDLPPGKDNIAKLLAGFNIACLLTGMVLSGWGCSPTTEEETDSDNTVQQEKQPDNIETGKYQPGEEIGPAGGKKIRGKSG